LSRSLDAGHSRFDSKEMSMMLNYRFFLALSVLGVGCSGSSSLGNDHTDPGAGTGGSNAGVGGTSVPPSTGGASTGGSKASAGAGGAMTGAAGTSAGSAAVTGGSPGATGGGPSTGGTGSSAGATLGGSGGSSAGTAGTDIGQGGDGPVVTEPKAVDDPDAPGAGPCDGKSANDVLDAVHEQHPELAAISGFYDPNLIGQSSLVYGFTTEAGFRLALAAGDGDCPAGCIDWEYWYFETDDTCTPQQVGHFSAKFGPGNCYTVVGEPMWGVPDHSPATRCAPADLNTACITGACSAGLEAVLYSDIAGMERCICSISCASDPNVCPEGTHCAGGADGPMDICYGD